MNKEFTKKSTAKLTQSIKRSQEEIEKRMMDENKKVKLRFGFSSFGGGKAQMPHSDESNCSKTLLHYSSSGSFKEGSARALWRAVIAQALIDAVTDAKRSERQIAKKTAMDWFNINNKNFIMTCMFADMCPYDVLQKSLDAIKASSQWKRTFFKSKTHYLFEEQLFNDKHEINL